MMLDEYPHADVFVVDYYGVDNEFSDCIDSFFSES
jgi:hypothetical protein